MVALRASSSTNCSMFIGHPLPHTRLRGVGLHGLDKGSVLPTKPRGLEHLRSPGQRAPESFSASPTADLLVIAGKQHLRHRRPTKYLWTRVLWGVQQRLYE